jgi:hypothetical protein
MTCLNANALDRTGIPADSRTCSDQGVSFHCGAAGLRTVKKEHRPLCVAPPLPGCKCAGITRETIESQITVIRAAKPLLSRCQAQSTSCTTSA